MIIPRSTAVITTLFSVIGFILLVVATCSVPVNEDIYLFELRGTTFNETSIARVGVLGLCGDYHGRSRNGHWTDMHDCSKEGLGFRITTTKNVTISDNGRIVPVRATVANKEFTRALVFNPLAATFSGIASILGMFMYVIDTSLCLSICTYIALATSAAFSWIAFSINIAITLRARSKVDDFATTPDQHVSLRIGPTSWIALGGAIAFTIGLVIWTVKHFNSPEDRRRHAVIRPRSHKEIDIGSQGSVRSMGYSTPASSRRQSHV